MTQLYGYNQLEMMIKENQRHFSEDQATQSEKPAYQTTTFGDTIFHMPSDFLPKNLIGEGSYGRVCAAKVISASSPGNDYLVAIKKVKFNDVNLKVLKACLREIKILRLLRKKKEIIQLKTLILPEQPTQLTDIYMVFDLMFYTLLDVIHLKQFGMDHLKFLARQLFRGVDYIHSRGFIHRDLKPTNILVQRNNDLKISDFGFARLGKQKSSKTLQFGTFSYSAPQIFFHHSNYDKSVDIWSIGCILAEMLLKKSLFSQKQTKQRINRIISFTGFKYSDLESLGIKDPKQISILDNLEEKEGSPSEFFSSVLNANPNDTATLQLIDLITKLLKLNPKQRITIEEALNHPFFTPSKPYKSPKESLVNEIEFEFENKQIARSQYLEMVYDEICLYHFKEAQLSYEHKIKNNLSFIPPLKNIHSSQMDEEAN